MFLQINKLLKFNKDSFVSFLILSVILFVPAKNIILYFSVVFLVLLFVSCKIRLTLEVKVIFIFIFYLLVSSLFRVFFKLNPNQRDFYEIFRFIVLLVFLSKEKAVFKISDYQIELIFFIYIFLNFILCYLQVNKQLGSFGTEISNIYVSVVHHKSSIIMGRRASGFSSGPGTNGVISVLLCIYFIIKIYMSTSRRVLIFRVVCSLLSIMSVLYTQSQTAFAVLIIINILIVLLYLVNGNKSQKAIARFNLLFVIISSFAFILVFFKEFRLLLTLFTKGTNRSSYQNRENKWSLIIDQMFSEPIYFLFGHGKDFFGHYSSSMDNEYLYIISIYGIVILFILVIILFKFIMKVFFNFKRYRSSFYDILLFFWLCSGIIISWPSSFILDPRVMLLLSVFILKRKEVYNEIVTIS